MKPPRAPPSATPPEALEGVAPFKTRLTREQHECLSRCARGISIRFERSELIDALVEAGYAEKGVAGVVTVTPRGKEYLQKQSS